MTAKALHSDCIACLDATTAVANPAGRTIAALATVAAVGLDQVERDLCFYHRRWFQEARDATMKAVT